jgi:insertion element IS1 protein InsB
LLKEGCGIRSISRILKISTNTVQNRILRTSKQLQKPVICFGNSYEVDELCTFIGSKSNRYWVAYALRKNDKAVVDFRVGKRTNKTLKPIIETLTISLAKTILKVIKFKNVYLIFSVLKVYFLLTVYNKEYIQCRSKTLG